MQFDEGAEQGTAIPDFLRDPLGIPGRRWPWMLLGLVTGLSLTAAVVKFAVPTFIATASILVNSQYIPEDFVRTTVREDPFSQLNALVGQVLSRSRLASLIDKYSLYPEERTESPLAEVVTSMRAKIKIAPVVSGVRNERKATSQLYSIAYEAEDPKIAAEVANALAGLFLEGGLKNRMERAMGITMFLKRELKRAESELKTQNAEISAYRQAHRGELPDELSANLSRLERLQSQHESSASQLTETHARLNQLYPGDAAVLSPPARLEQLRVRYDQEVAVNTPEHPNVASLRRQIDALEAELANTSPDTSNADRRGGAQRHAAQQEISIIEADIARFKSEAAEIDARVGRTPKHQEVLEEMGQRVSVLRENYLDFLRKVDQAELAQTLESNQYGAQISVMDIANPPANPVRSRSQLAVFGVVGSIALTLLMGLLFEFLNPLIIDAAQVESLSGLPVLGSIPRIS